MKDLEKANVNFQKWAASNTSGHSAWMITPQFRSMDGEFHVGWVGAYESAADFGSSTDKWVNASGSVSQAYTDTVDCSHAMMSSYATGGQGNAPGDGVVWFSRCSLEEAVMRTKHRVCSRLTSSDSADAYRTLPAKQRAITARWRSSGHPSGSWVAWVAMPVIMAKRARD